MLTVSGAASHGTRRELLVALRDRIAVEVESSDTPAHAMAALTKRLMDIVGEIEEIDEREKAKAGSDDGGEESPGDEAFNPEAV